MAVLLLFRVLIGITLIIVTYAIYKYLTSPERKLQNAKSQLEFYFLDDPNQTRKNIKFVYNGGLFIGEKHVGLSANTFGVLKVNITVQNYFDLQGLTKDDLLFLENEIHERYPHATIEWKSPINQLVANN